MNQVNEFKNKFNNAKNEVNNVKNEVNNALNQIQNYKNQLKVFTDLLPKIGECVRKIPGHKPFKQVLDDTIWSYNNGGLQQIQKYAMRDFMTPMIDEVMENVDQAVDLVKDFVGNLKLVTADGDIDSVAVGQVPQQAVQLSIDIIKLDPVAECLTSGNLLGDISNALMPIIGDLVTKMVPPRTSQLPLPLLLPRASVLPLPLLLPHLLPLLQPRALFGRLCLAVLTFSLASSGGRSTQSRSCGSS